MFITRNVRRETCLNPTLRSCGILCYLQLKWWPSDTNTQPSPRPRRAHIANVYVFDRWTHGHLLSAARRQTTTLFPSKNPNEANAVDVQIWAQIIFYKIHRPFCRFLSTLYSQPFPLLAFVRFPNNLRNKNVLCMCFMSQTNWAISWWHPAIGRLYIDGLLTVF